jgi:hypothetical protein
LVRCEPIECSRNHFLLLAWAHLIPRRRMWNLPFSYVELRFYWLLLSCCRDSSIMLESFVSAGPTHRKRHGYLMPKVASTANSQISSSACSWASWSPATAPTSPMPLPKQRGIALSLAIGSLLSYGSGTKNRRTEKSHKNFRSFFSAVSASSWECFCFHHS